MQPKFALNDNTHLVTPVRRTDTVTLIVDGQQLDVRYHRLTKHEAELTINGEVRKVYVAQDDNRIFLHLDGKVWQLDLLNEFGAGDAGNASSGAINAPMPGVVIEINVETGQQVKQGDTLMLIESMKLQTEIKASISGIVKKIGVESGANFDKGILLVEIETEEKSTEGEE
ncbi:MAG: biotin/lipoyl-binding protein [Pseudomonadales bacterium]|nr:biotin/lipoyl-binding protein [Pseudomonadales bacterium]